MLSPREVGVEDRSRADVIDDLDRAARHALGNRHGLDVQCGGEKHETVSSRPMSRHHTSDVTVDAALDELSTEPLASHPDRVRRSTSQQVAQKLVPQVRSGGRNDHRRKAAKRRAHEAARSGDFDGEAGECE